MATSTTSVVPRALRALLLLGALVILWWLAMAVAAGSHAAAAHASGADRRTPHRDVHPRAVADLIGGTGQALVEDSVTLSRTTVEQVDTALTRSPTGRVAAPVVRPVVDEVVSPTLDRLARTTDRDVADVIDPGDLTTVHPSPSGQSPKPAARADGGRTPGGPATRPAHEVVEVPDHTLPRVSLATPAPAAVPAPAQPVLDAPWSDGTAVHGVASSGAGTVGGGGGLALLMSADPTAAAPQTRVSRAQTASPHLAPPHEPGSTPD